MFQTNYLKCFLVEVSCKYGDTKITVDLNAGNRLDGIMKNLFESYLKEEYRNWIEGRTYLQLEGIRRKKSGNLLNTVEKFEPIDSDSWFQYGLDYKKLKATFLMKPSQSFLKIFSCNL